MTNSEPILAGLYPDPSICRVDGTYYLVTSSFEYLPGIPIHASTDLVAWTLVGNAIVRPSQMAENMGYGSSGNFAPTIRHHDGVFYIIGTNVNEIPEGRGHFVITAADPAGPWSDPVHVSGAIGIDPDLAWDDDGVAHVTWCSLNGEEPGIRSAPIDLTTGTMLSPSQELWAGIGLSAPEGPHLYRVDGWWYMLLAEGGTERGHTATIARARELTGPWEGAPRNPILSHRSLAHPVQNTGHADLIELADGTWAGVHLGVRPRGQSPSFHVNGRESFIVGVDWVDGWPVIDEDRYSVPPTDRSFRDTFSDQALHPRWVGVGRYPSSFTRVSPEGGLVITSAGEGCALMAARATGTEWTATARFDAEGEGRFILRLDERHQYGLSVDGTRVRAYAQIGSIDHTLGTLDVSGGVVESVSIRAKAPPARPHGFLVEPDLIELAAVVRGERHVLGELDGRYLSTEVAGGFTGRVFGIEAITGDVRLHEVEYAEAPNTATSASAHH